MAHRVFVTGATDFVGGYLVWKLRERGDEVRCLVSSPDEAGVLSKIGAKLVTGKVTDRASMRQAMKRCDAVFHLAEYYDAGLQ
ncbi:MAG: SDR family oxidoreductase, partial [Anaerolineae bacterium]